MKSEDHGKSGIAMDAGSLRFQNKVEAERDSG